MDYKVTEISILKTLDIEPLSLIIIVFREVNGREDPYGSTDNRSLEFQ